MTALVALLVASFAPVVANLLQTIVSEWIRRRATQRSHEAIADRVVAKMNGDTPRAGKP